MKCNICRHEMSNQGGLRLNCGGDCLHCMAVIESRSEEETVQGVVDLAAKYETELLRVQELLFRGMSPAIQKDVARQIDAVLLSNPGPRG